MKTPGLNAKALEASGGDAGVVNGVLGIAMPKVILDQPQVVAAVGQECGVIWAWRSAIADAAPRKEARRQKVRAAPPSTSWSWRVVTAALIRLPVSKIC